MNHLIIIISRKKIKKMVCISGGKGFGCAWNHGVRQCISSIESFYITHNFPNIFYAFQRFTWVFFCLRTLLCIFYQCTYSAQSTVRLIDVSVSGIFFSIFFSSSDFWVQCSKSVRFSSFALMVYSRLTNIQVDYVDGVSEYVLHAMSYEGGEKGGDRRHGMPSSWRIEHSIDFWTVRVEQSLHTIFE